MAYALAIPRMTNRLYYGDNLDVLREHIADDSIDLVYLDPPFNSNANYNILFKSPAGVGADSQIEAFEDTWHWNDKAEAAFHDVMTSGNTDVAELLRAMRGFLKENDMMAYLAMMAVRLIELHRVLNPTGSLYLHCDPTASHYLKLLLDGVFKGIGYRSEIIWKRTSSHNSAKRWGPVHDTIFHYSKSESFVWNEVFETYDEKYLDRFYRFNDEKGRFRIGDLTGAGTRAGHSGKPWRGYDPTSSGRHWAIPTGAIRRAGINGAFETLSPQGKLDQLDEIGLIYWPPKGKVPQFKRYLENDRGAPVQDMITDIGPISSQAQERLGYPTQKPLALLERIINASSNEGDVVLDPFCGCGTAVDAAQKLGRQWIGIDVTHLSIGLIERRLVDRYGPNGLATKQNPPRARLGEGDRQPQADGGGGERAALALLAAPPSSDADASAATSPSKLGEDFRLNYEVIGTPNDTDSALKLAADEPHQFQYWITQAIGGQPFQGGRKGKDGGIDGYIYFTKTDGGAGRSSTEAAIISVKAGQRVGVAMVRDLKGVMEREKADIGIFICVIVPTRDMEKEAAAAGVYTDAYTGQSYPRLQIYTLAEYFGGLRLKVPMLDRQAGFKKAAREVSGGKQGSLL